jgi:hypothetical protein
VRMRRRRCRCRCLSSRARAACALRSWARGGARCTRRFAPWHLRARIRCGRRDGEQNPAPALHHDQCSSVLFCSATATANCWLVRRPIWMPVDACQPAPTVRAEAVSLHLASDHVDLPFFTREPIGKATHPYVGEKVKARRRPRSRLFFSVLLCSGVWNLPEPHACTICWL